MTKSEELEIYVSKNRVDLSEWKIGTFTICSDNNFCSRCDVYNGIESCKINNLTLEELNELKHDYPEHFI